VGLARWRGLGMRVGWDMVGHRNVTGIARRARLARLAGWPVGALGPLFFGLFLSLRTHLGARVFPCFLIT